MVFALVSGDRSGVAAIGMALAIGVARPLAHRKLHHGRFLEIRSLLTYKAAPAAALATSNILSR